MTIAQDVGWQPGTSGEGTRAHWAATTPGFDAPEVTAKSMAHGLVVTAGASRRRRCSASSSGLAHWA